MKTKQLMVFREKIYSGDHMKNANILKNSRIFMFLILWEQRITICNLKS